VRFGLVGVGAIGLRHARVLLDGRVPNAELGAVVTRREVPLPADVPRCHSTADLLARHRIDAVLVCTPHPTHLEIARLVIEARLPLLLEKPLAARLDEAQSIATAAEAGGVLFGVMHQMRADPLYAHLRQGLREDRWGRPRRFSWTATDWFRPAAYFRSPPWRATWKGEGGGLLINQGVHDLDLLAWLFGRPAQIMAFVDFGKYHAIETDDNALAVLCFTDGLRGAYAASTGEAPGLRRVEIACDRALLTIEGRRLVVATLAEPPPQEAPAIGTPMPKPRIQTENREFAAPGALHAAIMENFAASILRGAPLIAPGREGLAAVELANAFLLSEWVKAPVDLPLDTREFGRRLEDLQARFRM